jgi:hypothetical protein
LHTDLHTALPTDAKTNGRTERQDSSVAADGGAAASGAGVAGTTGRRRRRVPVLVLAVVGAAIATAYGTLVLGMRASPPLVIVALGGFTLVLGAAALWRVVDPLTRAEDAPDADTRAPQRRRELEREKQAVLKAIKEIELDFQMRKISEVDYKEMVERYRTRALRVLGDLAVGDDYRALIERELKDRLAARTAAGASASASAPAAESPPAVTGGRACDVCGTPNDTDAQFCKKCGQILTSSPAQPA